MKLKHGNYFTSKDDRKSSRADNYQHIFAEVCITDIQWKIIGETHYNPESNELVEERIKEIKELIYEIVLDLMPVLLSDRQMEIIKLYFLEEKTQKEIGHMLGVDTNASRISIWGAAKMFYRNGVKIKKRPLKDEYGNLGGSMKILKRLKDLPEIKELLDELAELVNPDIY